MSDLAIKKISTFKIFRLQRAHNSYYHALPFQQKEMSDPVIKKVSTFKMFRLQRAHIISFKKGIVRSYNKKGPTFKIFHLHSGHISILCLSIKEMSDPAIKRVQPTK